MLYTATRGAHSQYFRPLPPFPRVTKLLLTYNAESGVSGLPSPTASKNDVFRLRSVGSMVIPPATTGSDSSSSNAVMAIDQVLLPCLPHSCMCNFFSPVPVYGLLFHFHLGR
jgi:hypothetical protein